MSAIPKGFEYNVKTDYMVQMFHVYKGYLPNRLVLTDINLEVRKGDFIAIKGPNGAGKTTLINLIAGQYLADQGEIIVNRRNLSRLKGKNLQIFRRTLGLMTQDQQFLPQETLCQNLTIISVLQGVPEKKVHKKVSETAGLLGLKDKLSLLPQQLSKGEQQLAALARSIMHEPVLLLADDPTDNLDPDKQIIVRRLLEQLSEDGMTIIFTTRDKNLDRSGRQRLIQLDKGRIVG